MDKAVNKKEYLKKYLAGSQKKKKKQKTTVTSSSFKTSKIVDDDLDLKNMRPLDESELDIYDLAEDAPQIAGIIDERPDDVKYMSQYKETKKWKVVTREYEDVKISAMGNSDSDASPPRVPPSVNTSKVGAASDVRVERRKSHADDSDVSPPRKQKAGFSHKTGKDSSSIFRQSKADSDGDLSPPRMKTHSRIDGSPSKRRHERMRDSYGDLSPTRKPKNSDDLSPPRKLKKSDDLSPPRKLKKSDDLSPPRKLIKSGDLSPPRKPKKSEDLSPPRRRRDFSPSRRTNDSSTKSKRDFIARDRSAWSERTHKSHGDEMQEERSRRHVKEKDSQSDPRCTGSMKTTLDGKKAGLQNASDMKMEAEELRQRQAESLKKLGDDVSGRGAAAVMRDRKTGRRRDLHEEALQKREKDAKAAEIVEKYAVWGKGVKQIEDKAAQMKEDLHVMSKPVARYADDEDLEAMQRNEEKEGDPMLEYMRHKRAKEGKSKPLKQQYQGSYLPNRYGIRPGHKWDGVDRSNGYEKKWFEEKNKRKALEEEAFKWSTEDM